MPKYPACSGAPFYGTPIRTAFAYPAVDETTGLTTELPTSEPAEAQVSYTIAAGHLPTLTGTPLAYELAPQVWAYGQNTSGGAATVSYRMSLNSTSVATATSSSITNNYYWAFSSQRNWGSTMPVVGDVLNLKFWANTSGVYLNAKAMAIAVTRAVLPGFYDIALCGATYGSGGAAIETSTEGAPSFGTRSAGSTYYAYPNIDTTYNHQLSNTSIPEVLCGGNTIYGMMRANYGDYAGSASFASSASSATSYYQRRLLSLSLLPLNIKL